VALESVFAQSTTSTLSQLAVSMEQRLWEIKLAHRPKSFWYPYPTLSNVAHLEQLSSNVSLNLLELCQGECGKVADIGAGDGDLAFFLESQGLSVDVIDNEETNFNSLKGVRVLKEALNSSITVRSVDLDSQFALPSEKYDVIFFLGTLYHLKNPFLILEKLAQISRYCFLSTRIARQTADGHPLSPYPLAYLLGSQECNNDFSNYWIFSDEGLKRLTDRTGWSRLSQLTTGDTTSSTPSEPDRDERAFCFLKHIEPALSASPNPVPSGTALGQTTISWSGGKVYVSMDGGKETVFGVPAQGCKVAHWIQAGRRYEFRLYNLDRTEILAKVVVSR
jgi:tRNA (mo5U34)-methyltransferase